MGFLPSSPARGDYLPQLPVVSVTVRGSYTALAATVSVSPQPLRQREQCLRETERDRQRVDMAAILAPYPVVVTDHISSNQWMTTMASDENDCLVNTNNGDTSPPASPTVTLRVIMQGKVSDSTLSSHMNCCSAVRFLFCSQYCNFPVYT